MSWCTCTHVGRPAPVLIDVVSIPGERDAGEKGWRNCFVGARLPYAVFDRSRDQ